MRTYKAERVDYQCICKALNAGEVYPYLRSSEGDEELFCISPLHGRSYVVCARADGTFVVSKGNGLSFTQHELLHTNNYQDDTWGILLRQDAIRDFVMGQEIADLGIRTNRMEYVLELNRVITLTNGHQLKPVLLQYTVECPYRICDAAFMPKAVLEMEIQKWERMNDGNFGIYHLIAANVLIRNLRILHDNQILHNAIHIQNYTWALELLDFELACSPSHPYTNEDDNRHVKELFPREILQTYEVINYIAWCLDEKIDYGTIDSLFLQYGFDLASFGRVIP